jgi:hypothetical protein
MEELTFGVEIIAIVRAFSREAEEFHWYVFEVESVLC